MARPVGVTVIGCCCLLAGVYLCSIARVMLVAPGAIPTVKPMPFVHALKFVSPYVTVVIGIFWALVAWGLFQMRDSARFTATLLLGIGVVWALSMLVFQRHSNRQILVACFEIVLRVSAISYLLAPSVIEAFRAKPSGESLSAHLSNKTRA